VVDAEVGPGRTGSVRCAGGRVVAIGPGRDVRPEPGDAVVDAGGGAVLRGLVDHHVHLLAEAAARASVDVGDGRLAEAVARGRAARPEGWLRLVGWRSATHGPLDRHALDRVDARPLRVLDATGSTWYLNSAGLALVLHRRDRHRPQDGPGGRLPPGLSLGPDGRPDGRLVRLDAWLRDRLGPAEVPDVRAVADGLAARGVTSLTDATATNGAGELALLAGAGMPQRLTVMTGSVDPGPTPPGVTLGPVKVLLDDDDLPAVDDLALRIDGAHRRDRAVAVHCVTRLQLVVALAAFEQAGPAPRPTSPASRLTGDRIEHGAVVPDELVARLAGLGLTVVTQPGFLADRGDRYLDEVDAHDRPWLYRVRGLLDAGVRVLAGSDAPFGPADPWIGVAAAVDRRAPDGRVVGPGEAVDLGTALGLYGSGPLRAGDPADLCVLAEPWRAVGADPAAATVVATFVGGGPVAGDPAPDRPG
jgi:predicted amidohydrolase YtcJ